MFYRQIGSAIAVRLERGEELVSSLLQVCKALQPGAATITGLGACDLARVGVYKVSEKKYYPVTLTGEHELVSLTGSLTAMQGEPYLHLHAAFGDDQGRVWGGHLNEARISATAEIFITPIGGEIGRHVDPVLGLNLLSL